MLEAVLVQSECAEFAVTGREFAHCQGGVADEEGKDHCNHTGEQYRVGFADEIGPLEEAGNGIESLVADQDGRHEEHVRHQEYGEGEAGNALLHVKAGWPAAFARRDMRRDMRLGVG